MRTSSISLVLFVAFVLVLASVQANAKRLTLEEKQKLKANRGRKLISSAQQKSEASVVPAAVVDAKPQKSEPSVVPTAVAGANKGSNTKDVVTDQNKGGKSGATEKNSGSTSTTGGKNNQESEANPTFGQYGAGSSSDSSPDTHRYYYVDDRTGRKDTDDRKTKN